MGEIDERGKRGIRESKSNEDVKGKNEEKGRENEEIMR